MVTADRVWIFLVTISILFSFVSAEEVSLVVGNSSKLLVSPKLQVKSSPGLTGTAVVCERVHIRGLSRLKHLGKYAHSIKVKVLQKKPSIIRRANAAVCFHRNASLGIGMCAQGKWKEIPKDSWVQAMSPFDNKLLDIRVTGSASDTLEISIEEEFFLYRIVFLIVGIILLTMASVLSKSLALYYTSAMTVGVLLVVLMILFQGMKVLPRQNSLGFLIYAAVVGVGSFFVGHLPGLLWSCLVEMGISEDMYTPIAIFVVAFLVLTGAWLGFWVVRKVILTEDGSIDISTSLFVAWAIRILAVVMILQSSLDPILAIQALGSSILLSSLLKIIFRQKFLRRMLRFANKCYEGLHVPDLSPVRNCLDEYMYKKNIDDTLVTKSRFKRLSPSTNAAQGITEMHRGQLSESDMYPSSFHHTPERRKLTKSEWEKLTQETTRKAVEELTSSPDFSKWVAANSDRISVTPSSNRNSIQPRKWFLWSSSS